MGGCKFTATEHGRCGLLYLYIEAVECMSNAASVWHVGVSVSYTMLLSKGDMNCLVCGRLYGAECQVEACEE